MIRVCMYANRINGKYQENYLAYERSLIRAGIPFEAYIDGRPFKWEYKVLWQLDTVKKNLNDHFVFTDAYDVLFVGTQKELADTITPYRLVFTTDRMNDEGNPWPRPHMKKYYDVHREAISPWRFLNGSGPVGHGHKIAAAIEFGMKAWTFPEEGTDQAFWTQVYLSGWGELDQNCTISQALWNMKDGEFGVKDGRFLNLVTGSKPQFIHATGNMWPFIPLELIPPTGAVSP